MGKPSRRRVRAKGRVGTYLQATRSPIVGFAVTLPLLLLYNVGLLLPGGGVGNGADLLSGLVSRQWGLWGMLGLNAVLVVGSVAALVWLARKGRFVAGHWAALIGEGLFYGVVLGLLVPWVLGHAFPMSVVPPARMSLLEVLSTSAGAGYWEELIFRLVFVGGAVAIARKASAGKGVAAKAWTVVVAFVAVVLSSLVFSLVHHMGAVESPEPYVFWYRVLAGAIFGGVFLGRGFAVAAYSHFLYDVLVMLL